MKVNKPPRGRWPLLMAALAVVCVAGAELLASYFFAPALFAQITDPVRQATHWVSRSTRQAAALAGEKVSSWWQAVTAPPPPLDPADIQQAGAPSIPSQTPLSDPAITEFKTVEGREILTGGTVEIVYFNQADEAWADKRYGTDPLGRYGCGPTALAMAAVSLTGGEYDPETVGQLSRQAGCWARRSGSYLSIVEKVAPLCGLEAEPLTDLSAEAVEQALLSGGIVMALMGPGHFTGGGHFILLRGVTLSGTLLVADPVSRERSLTEWEPETVLCELSASRANGAPLWVLTAAEPDQEGAAPGGAS